LKYRKFGRLDWPVSTLAFGAMRLPTIDGVAANIDEEKAIPMLRYAVDHGVNYIDTAYVYHGGNSEGVVGKALRDGYRDKVRIATKLWTPEVNSRDDLDRLFDISAKRLDSPKIDFYLIHGIKAGVWDRVKQFKMLDWAERLKADGKIGYIGFSFHDTLNVFKQVINEYPGWDFCQVQYNYMDIDYQVGTEGVRFAADKGLGIVVMEPIRGGSLSKEPPESIQKIWDASPYKRTRAEWALQWVWNHPEVSTVLSGMSTMDQVIENCVSAARSGPGTMTATEIATVDRVREEFRSLRAIDCTGCNYCMPCPAGVNIPANFQAYNSVKMMNDKKDYIRIAPGYATLCVECGECEENCPQHLPIRETLKVVAEMFDQPKQATKKS
jgi:uncharacterized protein